MKIGKKITMGYLVVIALMTIIAVISGVYLGMNSSISSEAYERYGIQQGNVGGMGYYYQQARAVTRDVILITGAANNEAAASKLTDVKKTLETAMSRLEDYKEQITEGIKDSDAKELFDAIVANIDKDNAIRSQIIELAENGQDDAAYIKLTQESSPIATEVSDQLPKLFEMMRESGTAELAHANLLAMIGIIVDACALGLGLLLSILLGTRIKNSIVRPVSQVEQAVIKLSEGNLNTRVNYQGKDEIGVLAKAYNESIDTLREYVMAIQSGMNSMAQGDFSVNCPVKFKGEFQKIQDSIDAFLEALNDSFHSINQVADQVSGGSDQVSNGAQALSQGATEQASAVDELDSTINGISHKVKENAENAAFASQEAQALGNGIVDNNQQMKEMIHAMDEISRSSDEISKIIKTIQDIAFQTNILALNAAVEAARAGAAGKGFAVVADEVRNLASKSSAAATDTTALIENSIRAVENGTKMAGDTAHSLEQIVLKARDVTEVINKISKASNEQATSVAQVSQGIDQISSVVQTNSATAQESAAASEQLSGQAQMLKQMLSKYKLKEEMGAMASPPPYEEPSYEPSFQNFSGNDKY